MTDQEILNKAIDKANKNGYGRDDIEIKGDFSEESFGIILVYSIIFSHEFAKAFWGEKETEYFRAFALDDQGYEEYNIYFKEWEWQLTKMVLEDNPIKYLEKFL